MEDKLEQVRMTLADANITGSDIENLRDIVDMLRYVCLLFSTVKVIWVQFLPDKNSI